MPSLQDLFVANHLTKKHYLMKVGLCNQIESNVEDGRRVRNCANRNKVHSGLCHLGGIGQT